MLTVQTVSGTLALDMGGANVGQYIYTPAASVTSATEQFGYNVIDGDGDTAGSTLTVTISPPAASATNKILIRWCSQRRPPQWRLTATIS